MISAGAEIIERCRSELDGASENGRSRYEKIIGIENPENEKLPDRAIQTQQARHTRGYILKNDHLVCNAC